MDIPDFHKLWGKTVIHTSEENIFHFSEENLFSPIVWLINSSWPLTAGPSPEPLECTIETPYTIIDLNGNSAKLETENWELRQLNGEKKKIGEREFLQIWRRITDWNTQLDGKKDWREGFFPKSDGELPQVGCNSLTMAEFKAGDLVFAKVGSKP